MSAFGLAADSPARNAGVVIPQHPTFGALPGAGASLDLGAIPFDGPREFTGYPFDQVN